MLSKYWPKLAVIILTIFGLTLIVASFVIAPINKSQPSKAVSQPPSPLAGVKREQSISVGDNQITDNRQKVKVDRVIDGDTIEIEGGLKVRYIGVDAPESTNTLECYGRESTNFNRQLVEGKIVELGKDISETDKFGRQLRYIYVDNIFVNQYLVIQGFAHATSYPPDIKYQDQLQKAEQEARDNNRGLWSQCSGNISGRSTQSSPSQSSPTSDCKIKGNISSSGEKIYHLPDQRYYDKTVIDETKGERWFCTEGDAIAAGWRKSKI